MLSRQEVNAMCHLANAQYWDRPAGGNTGRLFLAFGGPVCADQISNCQLDRVLTYYIKGSAGLEIKYQSFYQTSI